MDLMLGEWRQQLHLLFNDEHFVRRRNYMLTSINTYQRTMLVLITVNVLIFQLLDSNFVL